jgi:hypothetical protein
MNIYEDLLPDIISQPYSNWHKCCLTSLCIHHVITNCKKLKSEAGVTTNGTTFILNFMKISQVVQKFKLDVRMRAHTHTQIERDSMVVS